MKTRLILATAALTAMATAASWAQQPTPGTPADGPKGPPMAGQHGPRPGMVKMRGRMDGGFGRGTHFGMDRAWWKDPMLAEKIGLTPAQEKKLDDLSLQGELNLIHLRASVEEDELLLRVTLEAPTVDEGKADAQIDKVAEAHASVEKAEAHLAIGMRGVLTPEQWKKMHEEPGPMMMKRPGAPMHGARKHGDGGPGMPPPPPAAAQ
ncbi:MAG: periplasmic heavy metal sensor [Acidobacteriaceae bacterium]|nr:periplasmic heavy metal sensor [Acidobacteriaceae bacterium]